MMLCLWCLRSDRGQSGHLLHSIAGQIVSLQLTPEKPLDWVIFLLFPILSTLLISGNKAACPLSHEVTRTNKDLNVEPDKRKWNTGV